MTDISPKYDVIIVGAGPGGSACAGFLARAGVRTLLLDRAHFPRAKACGEYTSPASAAIIARLGATAALEAAAMQRHRGMTIVTATGQRFTVDYREAGSEYAAYATDRAAFDEALARHAVALGADFREGVRVEALLRNPATQVSGVRSTQMGDLAARWVVGADGAKSTIARLLGVSRPPPLRRLGLAAHYVGIAMGDVGEMHVASGDYCALNPLADGVVNVSPVLAINPSAVVRAGGLDAFFEATLRRFPAVIAQMQHAHRISAVRGVGPMANAVSRSADAGWLLVGDAAGFYDPFTGAGVHAALRSGELAASILITALAATEDPARTARRYRQARRREFTAKRRADALVQLFVRFPTLMRYVVPRLNRRPAVRAQLAALMGDLADPATVLTPRFFWQLLRPLYGHEWP
jgi:flavin-dependent dehydrogenase